MAIQLRSITRGFMFCMAIFVCANGEDLFEGITTSNVYKIDNPKYYINTKYHDSGWQRNLNSALMPKECCCNDKIKKFAENNVESIVGDSLSLAIDNMRLSIKALNKSSKLFNKKLTPNAKRLVQLESNWKNNREGTLLELKRLLTSVKKNTHCLSLEFNQEALKTDSEAMEEIYSHAVIY